ncbi:MAG TPA: GNAT family N-acetyltransferase [Kofleriaceae bacterium]|nr:GNAT family N-acetyltransferase [Kofleriaceae bacterium]
MLPGSERLSYRRLSAADASAFHRLLTDPHVRRYLLDGQIVDRPWSDEAIADSDRLFAARGLGLWLMFEAEGEDPIGFCGFRLFAEMSPEPQLIYALVESATGRGYATEAGQECLAVAAAQGLTSVIAAVDEPNAASIHVLEKLGFRRTGAVPGAFGQTICFERRG